MKHTPRSTHIQAVCAMLFLAVLLQAGYTGQRFWPNQLSRFSMLLAMVHEHSVRIDGLKSINMDIAEVDGHVYSDKAPGTAFLALPAFTATTGVLTVTGRHPLSAESTTVTLWLATLGSSGLFAALGTVAMFLCCLRLFPIQTACIAAAGMAFGTLQLPYSTQLFSHASTMGLVCIALLLVITPPPANASKTSGDTLTSWLLAGMVSGTLLALAQWNGATFVAGVLLAACSMLSLLVRSVLLAARGTLGARNADIVAGLACGMACIGEYPALLAALGMVCFTAYSSRHRALRMVSGVACPIALLLAYNTFAFGSPLTIGYQHNGAAWMQAGMLGIVPNINWDLMYALLISQGRGLFFWSPFLLLCLPGYWRLWLENCSLFWLCLLVPLATLGGLSLMQSAYGGYAVGPRYLAPAVPFITLAAAAGMKRFPFLGWILLLPSVVLNSLATVVDPLMPERVASPLFNYYLPALASGTFMPNIGQAFNLWGHWSLAPLACADILLVTGMIALILHARDASPGEHPTHRRAAKNTPA